MHIFSILIFLTDGNADFRLLGEGFSSCFFTVVVKTNAENKGKFK